ncbi:MAG: helix-turn-helix transcriptional regulator [Ruminococcaceae bacterium]|nr:helix-turn-helix transcriptional regulator [Oscillospiraceae bacterium]
MQDPKEIQKTIGKRIQELRKSKGFTQLNFSESIDLSPNYFSDIERGKSSPRIDKLVAIMNALDCSADDIFQDVISCGYKVKSSQLSERIENLSPDEQEKAFAILEAFIGKK